MAVCLASAAMLLAAAGPASAAPAKHGSGACYGVTPHNKSEALRNVTKVIHDLGRQHETAASIAQKLAKNCGLQIVSKALPGLASTNQDVTQSNPEIVYYPDYKVWSAFASWQWNRIPGSGETSIGCLSPCNVGGYDGFGIAFNRPVTVVDPNGPWSLSVNSQHYYFSTYYTTTPSDGNSNGVSFIGQDKLCLSKSGTSDCYGGNG